MYVMPREENPMMMNPHMHEALEAIKDAVHGEREDEMFYGYLIGISPSTEERGIITSIRDDERRHNKYFRRIYKDFTGMEIPEERQEDFERPESYSHGLRRALFGELDAVKRYRRIRKFMPRRFYRDMLFDIITDEIGHASRYNYLYTLDHRRSIPDMTRSSAESEDFVNIADKSYESPMAPMTPMTPTGPMSPVSPMPPTTPMTPSGSVPPNAKYF